MYRNLLYTEVLSQNGDFGISRVDCNEGIGIDVDEYKAIKYFQFLDHN